LHYDKFELKHKSITKARTAEENGKQIVRVNLPGVSITNLPKEVNVHHITFNLLVDNLKIDNPYSSNSIAKCPVLGYRNLSSFKYTLSFDKNQNIKVDTDSSSN
jgi:hypothetical protein